MAQTPSPLIFWAGTDPVPGALAEYLSSLAPSRSTLQVELSQLGADLAEPPEAQLILFYRSCETVLAQVLHGGADPARVLANWTDEMQALLGVQRQNRRRCLVIEADHFLRFASAGLSRLDLPAEALPDLPERFKPDPVMLLIAQNLLGEHPQATALAEELEAATTSLSNQEAPRASLPADLAVQSHLDRYARSKALEAEFERAQHSLSAQIAQITSLGARIETDSAARALMLEDLRQMEQAQAEAQRHLNSARAQITQQQGQLNAMRSDAGRARDEIAHLHGKIADLHGEIQAKDNEIGARADHIGHLEGELDRIWRSTSMRLTAPLRRVMGLLRPGRPAPAPNPDPDLNTDPNIAKDHTAGDRHD